jgi:hypothetical protein
MQRGGSPRGDGCVCQRGGAGVEGEGEVLGWKKKKR